MTKTMNPFKMGKSYATGFIFAFFYISLVITSNISFGILDDSESVCLANCKELTVDVELCEQQCGDTIENLSSDITFFDRLDKFKQDPLPTNLIFFNFTASSILWIMGTFVAGFIVGWGLGLFFRLFKGDK